LNTQAPSSLSGSAPDASPTASPSVTPSATRFALVLVGHGAPPATAPRELVARWKALEGQRRARGGPPSAEERELDARLRAWPRTPESDPYQAGLERLAAAARAELLAAAPSAELVVAYNEFCGPSLEEAVETLVKAGHDEVRVVPTMLTPGGVHSEVEIPETLAELGHRFPTVRFAYAWPFELRDVARLLVGRALADR
jgi:sirohydrochlorin cobaltochelatase